MGYSFRTYGGGGMRWGGGGLVSPGIKLLLLANAGVFLVQTILQLASPELARGLIQWFGLVPRLVTHSLAIWQPFTYLFLHGGLWHILINMLMLWMFGSDLERAWGRRRFLRYYFLTGAGAGVLNVVVKTAIAGVGGPESVAAAHIPTIGASGAVYGILLAAALLFPDRQVFLFPLPIALPMRVFVAIMAAVAFFGSLGATGDNISHITHLGGMLIGYIFLRRGNFLYGMRDRYGAWRRRRLRRKFDVYMRRRGQAPPRHPDDWVN